jgi:hypothetical protein
MRPFRFCLYVVVILPTLMAGAQEFVPSYQFERHLASNGMKVPEVRSASCRSNNIQLNAVIDGKGNLLKVEELKSKRRLSWPKRLIEQAMALVKRPYQPFQIGGKAASIKTVLQVHCQEQTAVR